MPSVDVTLWSGVTEDALSCYTTFRCNAWLEAVLIKSPSMGRGEEGRKRELEAGREGGWKEEGNPSIKLPPSILMQSGGFCPRSWVGRAAKCGQALGRDKSSDHLLSSGCVSDPRGSSQEPHHVQVMSAP